MLDELEALHPTLEQSVGDHDVGPQLGDLAGRLRAIRDDVEQLDGRLRVEEAPDVLGDLGDVLDQEQADLGGASGRHRGDDTTAPRSGGRPDVRGPDGSAVRVATLGGAAARQAGFAPIARRGRSPRRSGRGAAGKPQRRRATSTARSPPGPSGSSS
jgi:hypothetical protein